MSDFKFICPHCHRHIECDTRLEGNRLKCPACRAPIVVPSAAGAGSAPPVAGRVRSRRSLMVAVTLAVALVVAAGGFGLRKFLLHPRVLRPDAWVKVDESATGGLSGWGRPANPDGDCDFFVQQDAVMIKVPGSATAHDLAADVHQTNAPCVLQPVSGDFTVQVCVDGRFAPGMASTLAGRSAYNGAGLVVLADPRNVVTLARAVLQWPNKAPSAYANFEMRTEGRVQRFGQTHDHPLPQSGPVFLRLQRRGAQIRGAVSLDGTHWAELGPKAIPDQWPNELQAGVIAISTSAAEFAPEFTGYKMGQ